MNSFKTNSTQTPANVNTEAGTSGDDFEHAWMDEMTGFVGDNRNERIIEYLEAITNSETGAGASRT